MKTLAAPLLFALACSPPASGVVEPTAGTAGTASARPQPSAPAPAARALLLGPPDDCALSPDGESLALLRADTIELWSVNEGRPKWTARTSEKAQTITFAGTDVVTEDAAFDAASGRPTERRAAPPTAEPVARLSGLDPAAVQRVTAFAKPFGLDVRAEADVTTVTVPADKWSLGVHPSHDGTVLIVTHVDPRGNPLGQGFAAALDLRSGKSWRVDAWTTGGGSSTAEYLYGSSSPRPASAGVIWGAGSDRVVLTSTAQSGQMMFTSARLLDARSGKLVRDLGNTYEQLPRWSKTGKLLAAAGLDDAALVDASTGANTSKPGWFFGASFSEDDARVSLRSERGCEVLAATTGERLLTAPVSSPSDFGGLCVGTSILGERTDGVARFDLGAGKVRDLVRSRLRHGSKLVVDPTGATAAIAASDGIHRIDLRRFAVTTLAYPDGAESGSSAPAIALGPAGSRVAVALTSKRTIEIRGFADTSTVRSKRPILGEIVALAWTPDGSRVAALSRASNRLHLYVLDASTGAVTEHLKAELAGKRVDYSDVLAMHPSAPQLAVTASKPDSGEETVIVLDHHTGKIVATFAPPARFPQELAFTPNGELFLPFGPSADASVWSPTAGLRKLEGSRSLDMTARDAGRLEPATLLARWKDAARDDRSKSPAYCDGGGLRVFFDRHALRVERSEGARVRLLHARGGKLEGLLVVDDQGRFDGPPGIEELLPAAEPTLKDATVVHTREPELLRSLLGPAKRRSPLPRMRERAP